MGGGGSVVRVMVGGGTVRWPMVTAGGVVTIAWGYVHVSIWNERVSDNSLIPWLAEFNALQVLKSALHN